MIKNNINVEDPELQEELADILDYGYGDAGDLIDSIERKLKENEYNS